MPEGKDRRKTLCLKKKKKVNSPGAEDSPAWHRGRGPRGSAPGPSGFQGCMGGGAAPGRAGRRAALPRGLAESRAGQRHGQGRRAGTRRALAPARARAGALAGVGSRGTYNRLSSGFSCWCMASEKPKRLPGSPVLRITLSSRVSKLKAAPSQGRSPADR